MNRERGLFRKGEGKGRVNKEKQRERLYEEGRFVYGREGEGRIEEEARLGRKEERKV